MQLSQLERQIGTFADAHDKYLEITQDERGRPMIGLTNMDQARMGRISVKAGEIVYNRS